MDAPPKTTAATVARNQYILICGILYHRLSQSVAGADSRAMADASHQPYHKGVPDPGKVRPRPISAATCSRPASRPDWPKSNSNVHMSPFKLTHSSRSNWGFGCFERGISAVVIPQTNAADITPVSAIRHRFRTRRHGVGPGPMGSDRPIANTRAVRPKMTRHRRTQTSFQPARTSLAP